MTFGVIWDCLGYLRFNLGFQLCHNKKWMRQMMHPL